MKGKRVPALTIQPMVENAIRHGVRIREEGIVRVSTRLSDGFHEVEISDNGTGFDISDIDRQGSSVTRPQLASIIWEDRAYDRKLQKQLDVYIRSLRDTLHEYGIERIYEMKGGKLRVIPEEFDCDVYRFFEGDISVINAFRGEYMSDYSWASITEGRLFWEQGSQSSNK